MYTVEQIRKAGAKAQYRYAVEPIIEALQELYGSGNSQNSGNAIVSGALPALVGLSEYINNSYDFVDGDWYWKVDVEGDCPLSIEQVIANFISRQ